MFDRCNKTIQNHITRSIDFEIVVWDDPIKLHKVIWKKMYNPDWAKYDWEILTNLLEQIINIKQHDFENIEDYTKWFVQNKDIVKASVGKNIFDSFMKKTTAWVETSTKNGKDGT